MKKFPKLDEVDSCFKVVPPHANATHAPPPNPLSTLLSIYSCQLYLTLSVKGKLFKIILKDNGTCVIIVDTNKPCPYMGNIGMCGPKGCGFSVILVIGDRFWPFWSEIGCVFFSLWS